VYLRFNNYSKQKAKEILIELSKKSLDKYLLIKELRYDFVQELVEQVYDLSETQISDFIGNTKIDFYKSELEFICSIEQNRLKKIEQNRLKKIAFGTFVYYKLKSNGNNDYISFNHSAICQLGKLSIKKSERDELLERLSEIGCIDICGKKYRIPYCKNGDKSDIYKTISSYTIDENFYLLLEEYEGNKNVLTCEKCGSLFLSNKNRTKRYCDYCSQYHSQGYKTIKCVDCGKEIVISGNNKRQTRCGDCYALYRHNRKLETQRLRRSTIIKYTNQIRR
jgi:hypothetical protein